MYFGTDKLYNKNYIAFYCIENHWLCRWIKWLKLCIEKTPMI